MAPLLKHLLLKIQHKVILTYAKFSVNGTFGQNFRTNKDTLRQNSGSLFRNLYVGFRPIFIPGDSTVYYPFLQKAMEFSF
jgi:hypothetical protein